jgi:hypothetical protein
MECPACSFRHTPAYKPKVRSIPQHRRFFGMIKAAHTHWPERYEFQPTSVEELRKWLTAKAGFVHRTVIESPPDIIADDPRAVKLAMVWMGQALEAASRSHEHCWIRRHGSNFVVFVPKSVRFSEMGPTEFGALNDAVSAVIESVIGVDGDELLQRQKEVA